MTEVVQKSADEKFCSECGAIIKVRAEICPKCGIRQPDFANCFTVVAPNGKSKMAAALIALLLGGIGAHKFYLGKVGWGIVYLLFCWTGIPVLAGLIEGILLLGMSENEFNNKYGNT